VILGGVLRDNGGVAGSTYVAAAFKPARGLTYLAGFLAYGVGLSALYATTGFGLPCPFRALTGWECPLCGATRMGNSLLHLDLTSAFRYNPVVLIGLIVLTVLGGLWTVELLGGPRVRPPDQVADRLRRIHPNRWLVIGMTAAVIYTVLRNLL
jgi:hypothetical protein